MRRDHFRIVQLIPTQSPTHLIVRIKRFDPTTGAYRNGAPYIIGKDTARSHMVARALESVKTRALPFDRGYIRISADKTS